MSNFPDLSLHGYQIVRELGHNRAGGRITYLAITLKARQPVVIKQFQFAQSSATWSDYDSYKREIQVLQGLNHPGIPKYLESFPTKDGFCMVQEYKKALSLSAPRSFAADEIKQIAVSVLEILVYLQNRIPTVIHRDIKPENILVDGKINVFLVDFGMARIGEGEVAMSSVAKGTLGFMPPEQLFNRHLTEASDLYGLGTTLICLLTGIKSTAISELIDEDYRINFKHLVPKLSLCWIDWLTKMVELKPKDRYPNATVAMEALKPIYVQRVPEVKVSKSNLEFTATQLGQKLTQTFTVSNPIPDTVLAGTWEVTSHPSDPPHTPEKHAWISLHPNKFESNQSQCKITVNTGYLMASTTYSRQILLHTNSWPETYLIDIKVNTAPIPITTKKLPYISLALLVLFAAVAVWGEATAWNGVVANSGATGVAIAVFVTALVAIFGVAAAVAAGAMSRLVVSLFGLKLRGIKTASAILVVAVIAMFVAWFGNQFRPVETGIGLGILSVDVLAFMATVRAEGVAENCLTRGFSTSLAVGITSLAIALGISLGIGLQVGLLNPFVMLAVLLSGLPLTTIVLYPPLKRIELIANYRKSEQHLIKP